MAANGDYWGSLNTEDLQTCLAKLDILGGNVDPEMGLKDFCLIRPFCYFI